MKGRATFPKMNTAPEKRVPRVLAQAGLLTYQFDITWRQSIWRLPKFTFSPFTRDPNLQQTKFTRDPNLHISKFTQDPNLHETKFTHDPNLHKNLHKTRFTQVQIYTKPIFTRSQIYTNPNLHINRNSKEGQTYDIFLKSPWYEDLKNNSPECLACKHSFDQISPT